MMLFKNHLIAGCVQNIGKSIHYFENWLNKGKNHYLLFLYKLKFKVWQEMFERKCVFIAVSA